MGWAKYSEDIIKIKDDNFYNKKFSSFAKNKIGKVNINKKDTTKNSLNQELETIKISLVQIQTWIEFYLELEEYMHSNIIKEYLDFRIEDLENLKDEYYNLYFDNKFKEIRTQISVNSNEVRQIFLDNIKNDFLNVFASIFIKMRNTNMNESIELRRFYIDLEEYIRLANIKSIKKPYIDNVIKKLGNIKISDREICSCCKKNVYEQVYICTNCDYDKGE